MMTGMLENMTIALFGLERDLWIKTEDTEKNSYSTAMLCYACFLSLALISSVTLIYLVSGSLFLSLPTGLLVCLIIGSVVRFSLIILRRSIYDEVKTNPEGGTKTDQNESKGLNAKDRIKSLFKKINFTCFFFGVREGFSGFG